ncbi:hypothetical protein ABIA31_008382 [Catenulispora sp. MAP5-51]|uniref:hypothetical protein n=1 Tax=Catenulispora sp. MAP5-51 TaxID=3156298 RepID=UPI0035190812
MEDRRPQRHAVQPAKESRAAGLPGNRSGLRDEPGSASASNARPAAATTSPTIAGIRSPARPMTRPAKGAI